MGWHGIQAGPEFIRAPLHVELASLVGALRPNVHHVRLDASYLPAQATAELITYSLSHLPQFRNSL